MPNKSIANRMMNRVATTSGKIVTLLAGLLAATLILYSSYVIYDTFYIQNQAFGNSWELLEYRPEIIDDGSTPLGGSTLATINEDYRAWLTVFDTFIDYPVMQGPNDLYYSSHDINKKSSLTGALYLATDNSRDFSDNYNLIYGHHMDNSALFGGLDKYRDQTYFDEHREGMLVTEDNVYDLQIFAVIHTDAYDNMIYTVGNRDLNDLLTYIRYNHIQLDESVTENATQIVAFSTCESAETNGRLVVFAVMVKRDTTPSASAVTPEDNPTTEDPQITPVDEPTPGGDTPAGRPGTMIEDNETPLANFVNQFKPTGSSYGDRAWALVNLICVIVTIYLLIPFQRIKDKMNRAKTMKRLNENHTNDSLSGVRAAQVDASAVNGSAAYNVGKFRTHLIIGLALEIILSVAAVVAFILTENMRLPMTLIDKWTPLMLIILAVCWVVDLILVRNRQKKEETPEEE